jgi:hypothetical protein
MSRILLSLLLLVISVLVNAQPKNITVLTIPNFQPGKSVFQGAAPSYGGIYICFMSGDPLAPGFKNYVMKQYGATSWVQSSHKRVFKSIFPVPAENEKNEELSFYWTGVPVPDLDPISNATNSSAGLSDADAAKLADKMAALTMPAYGFYNLNNDVPSWDYPDKGNFMKIVSDNSERPSLYIVGQNEEDLSAMNMEVNVYVSSDVHTKGTGHKFEKLRTFDGEESSLINPYGVTFIPSNGKGDKYVIYAKGKSLVKVTANKQTSIIDLAAFGGSSSEITKIVLREGILWALVGNDIVKIRDNEPEKFYTTKSSISSFAVDNNEVFTNDGNRISIPFKAVKSLFGSGPVVPEKEKLINEAKQVLGQCIVETTADPVDQYVYCIHPSSGKIYKIQK